MSDKIICINCGECIADANGTSSPEVARLYKSNRELEGDLRMLSAFLVADKAPGESTWKSPFVSKGSEVHRIISKYEADE